MRSFPVVSTLHAACAWCWNTAKTINHRLSKTEQCDSRKTRLTKNHNAHRTFGIARTTVGSRPSSLLGILVPGSWSANIFLCRLQEQFTFSSYFRFARRPPSAKPFQRSSKIIRLFLHRSDGSLLRWLAKFKKKHPRLRNRQNHRHVLVASVCFRTKLKLHAPGKYLPGLPKSKRHLFCKYAGDHGRRLPPRCSLSPL